MNMKVSAMEACTRGLRHDFIESGSFVEVVHIAYAYRWSFRTKNPAWTLLSSLNTMM
jgi:hypothetical protein